METAKTEAGLTQGAEFRNVSSFDMRITESLAGWDHIVDTVRERSDDWKAASAHV